MSRDGRRFRSDVRRLQLSPSPRFRSGRLRPDRAPVRPESIFRSSLVAAAPGSSLISLRGARPASRSRAARCRHKQTHSRARRRPKRRCDNASSVALPVRHLGRRLDPFHATERHIRASNRDESVAQIFVAKPEVFRLDQIRKFGNSRRGSLHRETSVPESQTA